MDIDNLAAWMYFWIILGVCFGIAEVITTSFVMLPFAIGALLTALMAFFEVPLALQWIFFGLFSFILLFVLRRLVRDFLTSKKSLTARTNLDAYIGREAKVLKPIEGEFTRGVVQMDGETWTAVADDRQRFEIGTIVRVKAIDGAKLIVTKMEGDIQTSVP